MIEDVERQGGTVKLTEEGWFQRRIADFAYETALKKANGEKPVLGVNRYVDPDEKFDIELHPYDLSTATRQIDRLQRVRRERDNAKVGALLERLVAVAQDETQNIMPVTIELVRGGRVDGRHRREAEDGVGHVSREAGLLGHAWRERASARGRRSGLGTDQHHDRAADRLRRGDHRALPEGARGGPRVRPVRRAHHADLDGDRPRGHRDRRRPRRARRGVHGPRVWRAAPTRSAWRSSPRVPASPTR